MLRSTARIRVALIGAFALSVTSVSVPAYGTGGVADSTASAASTTVSGCGVTGVAPVQDGIIAEGLAETITSSPDGSRIYVTLTQIGELGSGVVSVRDAITLEEIAAMKVPGHYPYAGEVRLNATGTKGYLTTNSGTVQVFDATTNTMTTAIPAAHPESLAFSPDGSKVYILSYDGITVVDAMTDTIIDAWDLPEYDESVILNIDPTGNYGYLASPRKHLLQVIDLRTGSIVGTLALGGPPAPSLLRRTAERYT